MMLNLVEDGIYIDDMDYFAQLRAIHELISRNEAASEKLSKDIKEVADYLQNATAHHMQAENEWVDLMHHSVYQDAAHCIAAVGMIAPFIETLFYRAFLSIRPSFTAYRSDAKRWARSEGDPESWNCHFYYERSGERSENLVAGIKQLSSAVGLEVSGEWSMTIEALFAYRNRMLHLGFEWPLEDRTAFAKHMKNGGWPTSWFSSASSDNKPWVFYMTDEFIRHCLKFMEEVVVALGKLQNKLWHSSGT